MSYPRNKRLNEEIKKVTSEILRDRLRDPRIAPITSITEVEVTRDLSYATIFISVLGDDNSKQNTMKALESAKGFLRKEIGRELKLRHIPEILIKEDTSIEYGIKMSKKIDEIKREKDS